MDIGCCSKISQLRDVAEAGFDFAELAGTELAALSAPEISDLEHFLKEAALPCRAINMYCDASLFHVDEKPDRDRLLAYSEKISRIAAPLGAKFLGIGCPQCRTSRTGDFPAALQNLLEAIQLTAHSASSYGLTVLIEPVNSRYCNVLNTVSEGISAVQKCADPGVALLIDFCHCRLMEETDDEIIPGIPFARHIHIGHQDMKSGKRDFIRDGDLAEMEHICALLKACSYGGAVSMEAGGPGDFKAGITESLLTVRKAIKNAQA